MLDLLAVGLFDLPGPTFLAVFAVISGVGLIVAASVRWAARGSAVAPVGLPPLTTDAVAVLVGADRRLTDAVVAGLVGRG